MRAPPACILACTLAVAGLPGAAMAETIWPDHGHFALKPRVSIAVHPAPLLPPSQRPARIYAIELTTAPAEPADLHLALQRRRQRFAALGAARTGIEPRSSARMVDLLFDLPSIDDRLSANLGWQAVKFSSKAVNVTSPYSRDDLRVRDDFLPSAQLAFAATPRLTMRADYRETVRAYGDIGRIGALGLDMPTFRALRNDLRPERDSRTRVALSWMTPTLRLELAAYDGQVRDRLAFASQAYLPRNLGSTQLRGMALEAGHSLSRNLLWKLRYDRAQLDNGIAEQRLALGGSWHSGPWRGRVTAARTSGSAWGQGRRAVRVEAGIDYVPADPRAPRIGLHLTDPDRLMSGRLADQPLSGPIRAADQARALMLDAALRW